MSEQMVCATPKREGEINTEISRVDNQLCNLEETFDELEKRLARISGPPKECRKDVPDEEDTKTDLGCEIRGFSRRLASIVELMEIRIDLIEL